MHDVVSNLCCFLKRSYIWCWFILLQKSILVCLSCVVIFYVDPEKISFKFHGVHNFRSNNFLFFCKPCQMYTFDISYEFWFVAIFFGSLSVVYNAKLKWIGQFHGIFVNETNRSTWIGKFLMRKFFSLTVVLLRCLRCWLGQRILLDSNLNSWSWIGVSYLWLPPPLSRFGIIFFRMTQDDYCEFDENIPKRHRILWK